MSSAKKNILEYLDKISDDIIDEAEVLNRLEMLMRLEHSKERCKNEGTISDEDMREYFNKKYSQYEETVCG